MTNRDLWAIENASADLSVADVMINAVDLFVGETRAWVKPMPQSEHALEWIASLETLVAEVRGKVESAKKQIDTFVDEEVAARRQESKADAN